MRPFRSALVLGATLAASLFTACGSSSSSIAAGCKPADGIDTTSLHLVQSGTVSVATDASYPPQEFHDPNNPDQLEGVDVDIAKEFAKRLCLNANIQDFKFDNIITNVASGALGQQRFDASLSAFTITPDRQKQVDMIPYFQAGESMLLPNGNPHNIQSLNDLCGLTVAVESGTTEESDIDGSTGLNSSKGHCASKPVKLLTFDTQDQVIEQLLNGRADVAYQDSPVTIYYVTLNPGKVQEGPQTASPAPEGIVVRKDNANFENAIKMVLNDMRSDGTYKSILDKWQLKPESNYAYPPLP